MNLRRSRRLILAVALTNSACLLEQNPDFIGPLAESTETGDAGCPEGLADCDGEPGCEADLSEPSTCGSCSKRCEIGGQMLACVEDECTGEVWFSDLPDAMVDRQQPAENFGSEPILIVDGERDAYIELPSLGPLPSGATIHSIALHLTCTRPGAALDVHRVETPWDEISITGNNAPGLSGSSRILTFTPTIGDNSIELVGLLQSWRIGNPRRSLALRPSTNAGSDPEPGDFASREGDSPPRLSLSLSW